MAGALQLGDIINLGRLAWDIYRYGWSDDLNATRQYIEFGKDVKGLAQNLDILVDVVSKATTSLQDQGVYNAVVRWDSVSLHEIVGDYKATIYDCSELLRANDRYRVSSHALRNIEWNVLVQPQADQLRQRIFMHNAKISQILKPFEIDLLCRVRQDIAYMHADLADRITAVHYDVRRLIGVLTPDLEQALRQQSERRTFVLEIPIEISERFRIASVSERPEYGSDEGYELQELSDAFVLNYNKSTVTFSSGRLVTDRIPSVEQYVNLLKCVWLFRRIKNTPPLQESNPDSHWPSYIRQLEDDLSSECGRFNTELVKPEFITPTLRRDIFTIWPEKDPTPLVDVVTKDEMMEQLLEVPLESSTMSVQQKVKLLRRMGSDGQRFRIMITGTEQMASGRPRQQTEVIDFDITSVVINPHYALPDSNGTIREMILRRDERIARMSFTSMGDLFKFQQAVTGFKPWVSYITHNAMVSFVIAGRKDHVVEKACIQLWIPKQTDGSLVTNSDAAADASKAASPRRTSSMATSMFGGMSPTSPSLRRDSFPTKPFELSGESLSSPMGRQPSLPTIPQRQAPSAEMFSTSWPRQTSPGPIGTSPPRRSFFSMGGGGGPPRGAPTRKPVGQPPSPRHSGSLATTISNSTNGSLPGRSARTFSMSSAVSTTAVSTTSNSSNSEGQSVTVSTGTHTTGFLHRRPPAPMLVIFTQNPKDGQFSFVTIPIDEETAINPDRCNCRHAGRDGASCVIAAIEKRKGDASILARRYETTSRSGPTDWNLAKLALNNPTSTSDAAIWPNLRRLSIMFPDAQSRAKFGGTPNQCQCKIKKEGDLSRCLKAGHRGLWGEVQEFYRKKGNEYYKVRYEAQQHVVNGLMS